jgi:hypothetical protein
MKADELQRFNSINGGIQSYIPALAGILIKHGLKETIAKIDEELVKETSTPEKNNFLFIRQGLKELDKSGLERSIELTASHYQVYIKDFEFFNKTTACSDELTEAYSEWKKLASAAKEKFLEFEKWDPEKFLPSFGIKSELSSPWFNLNKLSEDFIYDQLDTVLKYKDDIDRIISKLYNVLVEGYISGNIPEEVDLSIFVSIKEKLDDKFARIVSLCRELDSGRKKMDESYKKFENSLSSLCKELIDKLPISAQVGLFRICEKKSKKDGYQQFPDLFGLENPESVT